LSAHVLDLGVCGCAIGGGSVAPRRLIDDRHACPDETTCRIVFADCERVLAVLYRQHGLAYDRRIIDHMLHKILKGVAPVFALALAAGIAGCDGHISVDGKEGVPLAELDLDGKAPTSLVLAGPDTVVVTHGDKLAITVGGDQEAADALRFTLDDKTLGVMRKNGWKGSGKATVRVTLPELTHLTLAGSGTVETDRMSGDAEAVIAGSGTARLNGIEADKLEVTIAGSGTLEAAGHAKSLELTVAGSGAARMAALKVDKAEVTIAGSGDASFASDGTVEATVMGSGDVTVTGSAKCTIKSMGSGKLHCSAGSTTSADGPPAPPAPPAPPPPPGDAATPQ
jgi:hypothetical protein